MVISLTTRYHLQLRVIDPSAAEASHVTPVISTWLATAAFVDIMIAMAMTWLVCLHIPILGTPVYDTSLQLWRAKSGIKTSDIMLNRLIRLVVETGMLTGKIW